MGTRLRTDRDGIALLIVMLLTMVVAAIAAGAALIGANSFLINQFDKRASLLEAVADAGLELGRARLNANAALYSDSSVASLELDAAVYDADGDVIPDVSRTVYSMPLGGGLGEYGNFAALVAIAEDASGLRVIRRLDLIQESFAVYAYFTDVEPSYLSFGNDDQLYGPVHSNDDIKIASEYATFLDDTTSGVTPILIPTTADLTRLEDRAAPANLAFTATGSGNEGQSTMRLEFISRDVDGDGVDEGFVRVYRSANTAWVTGNVQDSMNVTTNCGHQHPNGHFYTAVNDPLHQPHVVLTSSTSRCYLGGADELNALPSEPDGLFAASDSLGAWDVYPGSVHSSVSSEPDASYLFPIDRTIEPAFRGIIYVDGKVVVSGTVRGRLTLAATGNIIIGDDLVYNTDPATGTCEDMLGLFSGGRVIVADNTINAPQQPTGGNYFSFDDTTDEFIHASIMALTEFTVQSPGSGSTGAEPCNGMNWGRGCLAITGGLIQHTRGQVSGSGGTGYIKAYTHDTCAFTAPPPYFPGTGHFWRGRYYEVEPTTFDITAYYNALN